MPIPYDDCCGCCWNCCTKGPPQLLLPEGGASRLPPLPWLLALLLVLLPLLASAPRKSTVGGGVNGQEGG